MTRTLLERAAKALRAVWMQPDESHMLLEAMACFADIQAELARPQDPLDNLRLAVRRAWMSGCENYREFYDKELFAMLGIEHLQDLYSPDWERASEGFSVRGQVGPPPTGSPMNKE